MENLMLENKFFARQVHYKDAVCVLKYAFKTQNKFFCCILNKIKHFLKFTLEHVNT